MKPIRSQESIISAAIVCTLTSSLLAPASMAQSPQPAAQFTQSTSAPQQAPSFLRQAGQKLLESAQKRVINNVNQTLQNKAQPATNTSPQSTNQSPYTSATPDGSNQTGGTTIQSQYGSLTYPGSPTQQTTGSGTSVSERKQSAPCRSWIDSSDKPIACLLCIHGLGLQSNSYEYFGKEQSKRGLAVYAIDVRGFGSWMSAKGKTTVNFNDCLEDIRQALEAIHAANPGLPVYLLGESMGGAIALRAASMYPSLVDGLISSVPASERFNQGKTSMKVFLNLVTGLNLANVGNDLVNQATKNDKLKAQWQDDPLARLNLSPQELIQFQDFMNFNHDAAKKVSDMPVLFVQGTGDQLVKPEGTWELFNDVAAKDKSFFAVPGEHLIFEEAQTQDPGPRDQNFRVISSWLSTKVGRRQGRWRGQSNQTGSSGMGAGTRYGAGPGSMSFINTQGLEAPAQMIQNGQYADAIASLEQTRLQKPSDPNVLALLGRAYYQSGAPDKAGPLFRSAMRIRRSGGDQAQAFNSYLLGVSGAQTTATNVAGVIVPTPATIPPPAAQNSAPAYSGPLNVLTQLFGVSNPTATPAATTAAGKTKVLAFYANWADQCKTVNDSMSKLATNFGDRVVIQRVNIEDSANDSLADQYKIGPIPTVVFVSPNGQVGPTIIGESTYENYAQDLSSTIR